MAALPSYARLLFDSASESFDPSVVRTEMERGIPKQRILNSQVLVKVSANLLFMSAADVSAFEDWYFTTIKRIGWFDVRHPRTGVVTSMRFEGGSIGTLMPAAGAYALATRSVTLEYMR